MTIMIVNDRKYKLHPVYNAYGASKRGDVINIKRQKPSFGTKQRNGYMKITVRGVGQKQDKSMFVHRFVYECYHGVIQNGLHVDHINENIEDNRLPNLQLLTPSQNVKKSLKNKDFSYLKDSPRRRKCVKAADKETGDVSYYYSMYACEKHLGVSVAMILKICQKLPYHKFSKSKKDGKWYKFEFIDEDDLPLNYIKCDNNEKRKCVKATNEVTREVSYYYSMYSASQHLEIHYRSIQDVCEKITKSALSKKDNCWYKFEYINKDLPINFIKSKNIRPRRKTDEQIKERIKNYQTRDWKCPNCDKIFRNFSRFYHRKHCN